MWAMRPMAAFLAPGLKGGGREAFATANRADLPPTPHFLTTITAPLTLGLDSHRYRCCGNGVVAPVAERLGQRIAEVLT